jgi:hypothetical protein
MQPFVHTGQGCQMVCFQTKNHNLSKLWSELDWKMLIYFMAFWNILLRYAKFYGQLLIFVFIWYIFPVFGIVYQEKSGNPVTGNHFEKTIDI